MSTANGPAVMRPRQFDGKCRGFGRSHHSEVSFRRAHVLDTRHCPMLLPGKQVEDACHIDVVHADACHIDVVHVAT